MDHPEVASFPVRVTARSAQERVAWEGETLRVWVRAAPVDGRANKAVCAAIAAALGIANSRVAIIRGHTARRKVVQVEGMPVEAVRARLGG